MIPSNPFVLLLIYILFIIGIVLALDYLLRRMEVGNPLRAIVLAVIGVLLLFAAFAMAGLPIFS